MAYTWAQCCSYLRLARQQHAQTRLDRVVDTSNAFAGGDGARKLVRALGDQAEA